MEPPALGLGLPDTAPLACVSESVATLCTSVPGSVGCGVILSVLCRVGVRRAGEGASEAVGREAKKLGINVLLLYQWLFAHASSFAPLSTRLAWAKVDAPQSVSDDPPSTTTHSTLPPTTPPASVTHLSRAALDVSGFVSVLVETNTQPHVRVFLATLPADLADRFFATLMHLLLSPRCAPQLAVACLANALAIFAHSNDLQARLPPLLAQLQSLLAPEDPATVQILLNDCRALHAMCEYIEAPLFGGIKMKTLTIMLHELQYLLSLSQIQGLDRPRLKIVFQQHANVRFCALEYMEVAFDLLADALCGSQYTNPDENAIAFLDSGSHSLTDESHLLLSNSTSGFAASPSFTALQPQGFAWMQPPVHSNIPSHSVASHPLLAPPMQHHQQLMHAQIYPTPQESPTVHNTPIHPDMKLLILRSVSDVGIMQACQAFGLSVLQVRSWCFDPSLIAKLNETGSISSLIQTPSLSPSDPLGTHCCVFWTSPSPAYTFSSFKMESNGAISTLLTFLHQHIPLSPTPPLSHVRTYVACLDASHTTLSPTAYADFGHQAYLSCLAPSPKTPLSRLQTMLHSMAFDVITMVFRDCNESRGRRVDVQGYERIVRGLMEGARDAAVAAGEEGGVLDVEGLVENLMDFVKQAVKG
ncbi:hypothetical protein HDU98_010123 [Podochytrium sp. JEL0797]|nr:hypothetical protein HDU98_010123 [Podochytrium sp. JEL0797]